MAQQIRFGRDCDQARAGHWTQRLGLATLQHRLPAELSLGQQQRVPLLGAENMAAGRAIAPDRIDVGDVLQPATNDETVLQAPKYLPEAVVQVPQRDADAIRSAACARLASRLAAVAAGFLLPVDAAIIVDAAVAAPIFGPPAPSGPPR